MVLLTIADTNSFTGFVFNTLVTSVGGDLLILGLVVFAGLAGLLLLSGARASTAIMIGVGFVFMFSLLVPAFAFLFWLAVIVALFVLINALRKQVTSY